LEDVLEIYNDKLIFELLEFIIITNISNSTYFFCLRNASLRMRCSFVSIFKFYLFQNRIYPPLR